jgi:Cytochrome P450
MLCIVLTTFPSIGGADTVRLRSHHQKMIIEANFYDSNQTTSTLKIFLLAMILHPEAQKKAQNEIDAVVGQSRLPNFDDRDSLVYVEALVREVMRWHPPVPLGLLPAFHAAR